MLNVKVLSWMKIKFYSKLRFETNLFTAQQERKKTSLKQICNFLLNVIEKNFHACKVLMSYVNTKALNKNNIFGVVI